MKLRKTKDGEYTMREEVDGVETKEAGYKFVRINDVGERKLEKR
jgi:hypothetical protein